MAEEKLSEAEFIDRLMSMITSRYPDDPSVADEALSQLAAWLVYRSGMGPEGSWERFEGQPFIELPSPEKAKDIISGYEKVRRPTRQFKGYR